MCGRFTLSVTTKDVIEDYFSVDASGEHADLSPRYNIAPSQDIAVIKKLDSFPMEKSLQWTFSNAV